MWMGFGYKTVGEFREEIRGTTPVLGRNKKLRISFSGDKPRVIDDEVIFPDMSATTELDTTTLKIFRGWVDHEASMIRYSDREYYDTKSDLIEEKPLLHNLFTTIEGLRVENQYSDTYGGAEKNFTALNKAVAEYAIDEKFKGNALIAPALSLFTHLEKPGVYAWLTERAYERRMDVEKIKEYVQEIKDLTSTEDSFELAQRILKENGGEEEKDPQEGEGEGDPSEGERVVNMLDVIAQTIPKFEFKNDDDMEYRVLSYEHDKEFHWNKSPKFQESIDGYQEMKESIDSSVMTLKRKLELLIQSKRKIEWDRMKENGRFDSKRLVDAYNGSPNVFKIREDASDLNTAVTILVDLSGSMHNQKANVAAQTCLLLAECLTKIGVPYEVLGFDTTDFSANSGDIRFHKSGTKYSRKDALRHYVFKKFPDRFFDVRKYFANMSASFCSSGSFAWGANCDGESVMWAFGRLAKRTERRKVLFVLSDGWPSCETDSNASLYRNLKEVVDIASKQADVVGIGIMSDAVKKFYPNSVVISDVSQLPTTCLKLLRDALIPKVKGKKNA